MAAPAAAVPLPPTGHAKYKWKSHFCGETGNGYRSHASIRTEVHRVPDAKKTYYQEVDIRIDKRVGAETSYTWRKVASKRYDWSRFTAAALVTYSTSGIRTGLQPDAGELTAKATVTLREALPGLPDKKVWRYTTRSPIFSCLGVTAA